MGRGIFFNMGFYLALSASLLFSVPTTNVEAKKECGTSICRIPSENGKQGYDGLQTSPFETISRVSIARLDKDANQGVEKKPLKPVKPTNGRIHGKFVMLYEFNPEDIGIDFIVSEQPKSFGYFIEKARQEYGNNLEFVTTANFYDMNNKKLVGKVRGKDGIVHNDGIVLNDTCIIYREGRLDIIKIKEFKKKDIFAQGFLYLIRHGKQSKEAFRAGIEPKKKRQRSALGIRKDGEALLVYTDASIPELQKILKDLNCRESVYLDSGNSRAFYADGQIYRRDNPNRPLGDVMVGYRR